MNDNRSITNEELVKLIQQGINEKENLLKLFENNRSLIIKFVKPFYRGCNGYTGVPVIELEELIQESYFGIVKAAKSYKESEGVLFITYASHYIKQSARRFIENCGRVVRVPVYKQQLIYKYNEIRSYFLNTYNREPSVYEYSRLLEIKVNKVIELQSYIFKKDVKSLDDTISSDDESISLCELISDDKDLENEVVDRLSTEKIIDDVMNTVIKDELSRRVIEYRYLKQLSLDEIGNKIGVSRERVRQIESKAMRNIRCNSLTRRIAKESYI